MSQYLMQRIGLLLICLLPMASVLTMMWVEQSIVDVAQGVALELMVEWV
ncbi:MULTISPECIES: hypothetical protein [Alcaligenes]|nr:hypothetical protein [Alcaligenes faecalis]MCX5593020.1 hypothetical protein [Alcaligenes faecalis]QQC31915.1 hypothetical protein I6H81_14870 [Alcaligenes faecalis]